MSTYARIGGFPSRALAELAVTYLNANGIDAMVVADDAGGTYPHLALYRGIRLRVPAEDAEAAQALLDEADMTPTDAPIRAVDAALDLRPVAKWVVRLAAAAVVAGLAYTALPPR